MLRLTQTQETKSYDHPQAQKREHFTSRGRPNKTQMWLTMQALSFVRLVALETLGNLFPQFF